MEGNPNRGVSNSTAHLGMRRSWYQVTSRVRGATVRKNEDILPRILCSLAILELVLVVIIGTYYLCSREKKKQKERETKA